MSMNAIALETSKLAATRSAHVIAREARSADAAIFTESLARAGAVRERLSASSSRDAAETSRTHHSDRRTLTEARRNADDSERALDEAPDARDDTSHTADPVENVDSKVSDERAAADDDATKAPTDKLESPSENPSNGDASAAVIGHTTAPPRDPKTSILSGGEGDPSIASASDADGPSTSSSLELGASALAPGAAGGSNADASNGDGSTVSTAKASSSTPGPSAATTTSTHGAQSVIDFAPSAPPTQTTASNQAAPQPPQPEPQPLTDEVNVGRVARGLRGAVNQQGGSLTLRLHPPELGFVRIEMKLSDGVVRAQLTTETNAARSMLQQNMTHLRDALSNHGLTVDRLDVQSSQNQSAAYMSRDDASADDGRSRGRFEQQAQRDSSGGDAQESTAGFDETLINAVA